MASTIVRLGSCAAALRAAVPSNRKMARRLRNSRPRAIERKTHPLDPCTLGQSSPKPRAIFRYLGAIQVGRSSMPSPAAGTIGAAASKAVRPSRPLRIEMRTSGSLPAARGSRHVRRRATPRHPPTSGPPRCPEFPRGFGEDCPSVQGSNAALRAFDRCRAASSAAAGEIPDSREPRRVQRCGAGTQAADVSVSLSGEHPFATATDASASRCGPAWNQTAAATGTAPGSAARHPPG